MLHWQSYHFWHKGANVGSSFQADCNDLAGFREPVLCQPQIIDECMEQVHAGTHAAGLDFISAAGMITSELGPFPIPHIQGPAGREQAFRECSSIAALQIRPGSGTVRECDRRLLVAMDKSRASICPLVSLRGTSLSVAANRHN